MSPLMEMLKRGRTGGTNERLRRLLACHLTENQLNPGTDDSLLVQVVPVTDEVPSPDQSFMASAKGFLDQTFSLVATEPLPHREIVVGITTGQILSLFDAETGEATFLGGRLWQTDVELTDIVDGEAYARLASRM